MINNYSVELSSSSILSLSISMCKFYLGLSEQQFGDGIIATLKKLEESQEKVIENCIGSPPKEKGIFNNKL